jgi:hypothetical protein
MKNYKFPLFFAVALAAVMAICASILIPSMTIKAEATTSTASAATPTTQCGFIDSLVKDNNLMMAEASATVDTTPSATVTPAPTLAVVSPTQAATENNSGELGDEALTTYRDTTQGFSIDYPHSWSQETSFHNGVCFTARDASIAVQFVKGTLPTDLMAYVKADEANVQAVSPGYQQVYLKASTEVAGAVILGYEWDAGKSIVTEKPVHARTDRYYLVDSIGRLVVVTETEPINQFDPDGVRDTALTYQVVK